MSKIITGSQVLALLQTHMHCTAEVPHQHQVLQVIQIISSGTTASKLVCLCTIATLHSIAQLIRLGQADSHAKQLALLQFFGKHRMVTESVQAQNGDRICTKSLT